VSSELSHLARGRMELDASLYALKGAEILRNLRVSAFATALMWRERFWFDDAGQRYHKEGMAAAARGVKVTRVFLLEDRNVTIAPEFVELIEQQAKAGIDVRIAYGSELTPDLLVSFAIWDDSIAMYTQWVPNSSFRLGATFHTAEAELLKAHRLRDLIVSASVEWADVRSSYLRPAEP